MSRRLGVVALLAVLAVGACDQRVERGRPANDAKTTAFRHALSGDVSGEYRPAQPDGSGVVSLFIGQTAAFEAWEAGDRGAPPLILTLAGPQGEVRVLPIRYQITDDAVRMTGATAGGEVRFEARIDQDALATARRNLGDRTVVISGTVQVDGRRAPVALTAWNGD
ncbi:hypothetical protein SH203_00428 [Brevundimonas sp. SH203]|uniref:hypothetical protein n=1 Tax=Brevundimonas sp. SH203 TaxID=345167 RepID=UPI0009D1FA1C|nr:hypothetical protein [Brevundimonas sp. SH203]GAW40040.1 hypothetical protein SH203_00428 [Brevundimonas sp. SH203]